jgi:hypothetical protein
MPDETPFSASDPALGYLFQCRYALLHSLQKLRNVDDDFIVSIETLDDVVFETKGQPVELLQTKHHLSRSANLTDGSADLWKTIRIWCEGTAKGFVPEGSLFFLLTTSAASPGSAAFLLRSAGRDVDTAFQRMVATAQSSINRENEKAYTVFLKNPAISRAVLESTIVLDSSDDILEAGESIKKVIKLIVYKQFSDSFVRMLEGWWFNRSIKQLAKVNGPILSEEIEDQIDELREQFKEDNLPIDDSILSAEVDHLPYLNEVFVQQLRLINIRNPRILIAIREYFRALEQRSRWIREDLLLVGELDKYERRLTEEWQIWFEGMREELGDDAAEEEKIKSAQALYRWVETQAGFPIRPRCNEPFVTRGTFHILANGQKLGWHPDFADRLRLILEKSEADS